MNKQKFFILDGSSLLYRAYYALPLLESGAGVYTNAIVGFSNMLVKLLNDWRPDYLAIAFDKGKHTFRTDMFAEYKGTRKPMPEELRSQVPMLHELTHLPIVVDPSHATGSARLVPPMALAAAAGGADGVMIAVHNDPMHALCDGAQALTPDQFAALAEKVRRVREAVTL